MGSKENVHLVKEILESNTLSENSKISQIFELCLEPKTKEDLDSILLNFREKIKTIQESEFFGIFDYVSMYVLDYVYNHDTASFCSVSRTLYLYQMLDQLISEGENQSLTGDCDKECLFKSLRKFTNVYDDSVSEDMLVEIGLSAILTGNLGLALYLVKFKLIEIASEVNEKCKKMFEILVNAFNDSFKPITENVQEDDLETPVHLKELLNQIQKNEIDVKRSILIFCILTIVAEYKMYEKLEVDLEDIEFYVTHKKHMCLRKLICVRLYIFETAKLMLTFKDIENFTDVFLNPFLTAEVGKSLVETCRKLLDDSHIYYNPRSLKSLARLKVRSIFPNSMSVPKQVSKLKIPVDLKKYLNFHDGRGIWKFLEKYHLNLSLEKALSRYSEEIVEHFQQAIENQNVLEVEDRNVRVLESGNERELQDGNVRELESENERELQDENVRELESENERELQDGNVRELESENERELEDGSERELQDKNERELQDGSERELQDENERELDDGSELELHGGNYQELEGGSEQEFEDRNFSTKRGGNMSK